MSFRLFIHYCAVCGGCAAFLGWVLGRLLTAQHHVTRAALQGLFLGLTVALTLSLVDALWNVGPRRFGEVVGRALFAGVVGCVGGFVGGLLGQVLYAGTQLALCLIFGWMITGLLIGASLGAYDVLARLLRDEDLRDVWRKIRNGVLGGSLGGLLGGILYLVLQLGWGLILGDRSGDYWSPSATGFVALGVCIGLLIGLAQVILKEAWLRVEAGFRSGRELILAAPEVTIGRGEGCDVGLFGDPGVEKLHASILRQGDGFTLCDHDSAGGTFVNGERIDSPYPLRSGDEIRLGRCVLRFGERRKRSNQ
jgi:hypothetical protein